MTYPRDMRGYGKNAPKVAWPNGAKIAVQIVLNYEEGGENCLLHGDQMSEAFLSEIIGAENWQNLRHWNMESIYEYGARAGFWRLHKLFTELTIPITVFGVATALMRAPEQVAAMQDANWEIASHGLKWIEYKDYSIEEERKEISKTIAIHEAVTGVEPRGWYTGRCSVNTVDLVSETGQFDYISDAYCDDLPYWRNHQGHSQLIIPYALDTNDMRFATPQGFNTGDHFFNYLKDSFDTLYAEGQQGKASMMSIGLHCRLIGRPGRVEGLKRFLEYILQKDDVWMAKRIDIAKHWARFHPALLKQLTPSEMSKSEFINHFGSIYEHSPWVAEQAFERGIGAANDTALGLNAALRTEFRLASSEKKIAVLNAHPDLAGKLGAAHLLTEDSQSEQASVGLDQLSEKEKIAFEELNAKYTKKFNFPFIIAVRDFTRNEILAEFEKRILNSKEQELKNAFEMVERIAELRIKTILENE